MTWTRTKPTVPDWYWYHGKYTVEPVKVVRASNGRLYARLWDWIDDMHGEWSSEAIVAPEEK